MAESVGERSLATAPAVKRPGRPFDIRRHVTMHENSPCQRLRLAAGRRGLTALAAVLACGAIGLAAGPAAQAAAGPGAPAALPPGNTVLKGVSAVSASDAWAVGYAENSSDALSSLILHWNGTSWTKVASPSPGTEANLSAVSAVNASDAWAVGTYVNSAGSTVTLILHWNGTTWAQVASPNPGTGTSKSEELRAVSVVSASDAWAVGCYLDSDGDFQTLALHWNGTTWAQVATPNPAGASSLNQLNGVSTVSASDAWAVGFYPSTSDGADITLTLHWNGTKWTQVSSPIGSGTASSELLGVSARTGSDIWAAGYGETSGEVNESLVLHSNGTSWTQDTTPNPGGIEGTTYLNGVSADSASDAWAVGYFTQSDTALATLALHWNGTTWTQVTTPNPDGTSPDNQPHNYLTAVSARTSSDAWAVGYFTETPAGKEPNPDQTLILHWNGTSWKQVTSPN
jgi:hypothetical protein